MAGGDYRSCDKCGHKAFYDANLNYHTNDEPGVVLGLDYLGDWTVLCIDCAKQWQCVTVPRADVAAAPLVAGAPKHTPGPWRVESDDQGVFVTADDGRPGYVCQILDEVIGHVHEEAANIAADAALIAAAPELLRLLVEAPGIIHESAGCPEDFVRELDAAIVKARGGA